MAQKFWRLARRERGAYPQGSVTSEPRRQPPKEPASMLKLFFRDALFGQISNPARSGMKQHNQRATVIKLGRRKSQAGPVVIASVLSASTLLSQAADSTTNPPAGSLADLSVEQLMNESVTSVSKRETKFNESAAAISVITQDDIRRLGITTIPDALRLVPGVDVAQINSHEWAVSVRGFNNEFANKLLVLVDGRSVYDNTFGGVLWDAQSLPMEDIDRIEVIRGPGASLWGANAVNGVVNIITKSARDTQGVLVSVEGGTLDQPGALVRYGGTLATNLYYRAYAKVLNSAGLVTSAGQDAPDRSLNVRGGGRLDWEPSDDDKLTLEGDIYRERLVENQDVYSVSPPLPYYQNYNAVNYNSGGDVLGRWTHDVSDTQSLAVQAYYDRVRDEQAGSIRNLNTYDLDAQHRFALGNRNEITWGLGYRESVADLGPSYFVTWNPPAAHDHLYSSFVQDEISLIPDRLKLILGSKFEHNDYTGFDVQPSGRLLWTPTDRQSVWAAVSRATRTPTWADMHAQTTVAVIPPSSPAAPATLITSDGNPDLETETLLAYELGYRAEASRHLSFDVATFYNQYDRLTDAGPISATSYPPLTPYYQLAVTEGNITSGDSYGAEVSARWDVTDYWHLIANYSWLYLQLPSESMYFRSGPEHQAQLRSTLDLPCRLELNGSVSFVDQFNTSTLSGEMTVPSYIRLDLGLIWHATGNLDLGIWGQNLTGDQHIEYTSYKTSLLTEIPRSVMGRITWHF
jgi:iron complex outermembrane receptor protein